jgi:hypothetical protein
MGFTLPVHSHALPGYDREAADVLAAPLLGDVDDEVQEDGPDAVR